MIPFQKKMLKSVPQNLFGLVYLFCCLIMDVGYWMETGELISRGRGNEGGGGGGGLKCR